jgi:glycosyltransferase involved in cell wall biosynthesis
MNLSLVSIVVPVYNASSTLDNTIASIVGQTHNSWELLVYLDAPTDDSAAIAQKWSERDERICLIVSQKNRGVVVGRNICIRLAKGHFLAFCDADDWWQKEKLSGQLDEMEKAKANFCYGSAIYVDSKGGWKSRPARMPSKLDLSRLYQGNPIGLSTVVYDLDQLGKYYFKKLPAPYVHEDYEYWLRVFQHADIRPVYDERPDTFVTIHLGTRSGNKWLAIRSQYFILRKDHHLSLAKTLFCMCSYFFWALYKRGIHTWLVQLGWLGKDKNKLP